MIVRHAVGDVDIALVVERDRTRLAELRLAGNEGAFLVEHLHALVAAVRNIEASLRVSLMSCGSLNCSGRLPSDPTPPPHGLDELPVLRQPHETVVAAARPVHVSLCLGRVSFPPWPSVIQMSPFCAIDDAGRAVEMFSSAPGTPASPSLITSFAVRAELVDLMPHALLEACRTARVAGGAPSVTQTNPSRSMKNP